MSTHPQYAYQTVSDQISLVTIRGPKVKSILISSLM